MTVYDRLGVAPVINAKGGSGATFLAKMSSAVSMVISVVRIILFVLTAPPCESVLSIQSALPSSSCRR